MSELKELEALLAPKLGPMKKITNVEIVKPPSKGAGSVMLLVKLSVKDVENKEEIIRLVAKKVPNSELARKAFSIQQSFQKEVAFYETIIPTLHRFHEEEGVSILDNFAEYYGARYNLHGRNNEVDDDAVLLLEDLSVKGFSNFNKETGFDLKAAENVLRDVAKFHGTVIALKQKKPDIFETKIKPHCDPFIFIKGSPVRDVVVYMKKLVETFPDCGEFAEKAMIFLESNTPTICRDPYGSISHFDLWVNNIMNKTENGKIVQNIFVDFQIYGYRSVSADVFFFLWTSVPKEVLEENLDHLLHHYHRNLINTLGNFRVDTSTIKYDSFLEEIKVESEFEFGHTLMFLFIITCLKDVEMNSMKDFTFELTKVSPKFRERVHFMVTECIKRGWLKQNL